MKRCTNCGVIVKNTNTQFCPSCGNEMVSVRSEAIAQDGQGFCMFCGIPFNEFGVCAKCGNRQSDQVKATTKQEHYWDKLLGCLKALFSNSPFNGIENAGREIGHTIWPICLAVFTVFTSLGLTNVLCQRVEAAEFKKGLMLAQALNLGKEFGPILLKVMLSLVITFFISTALLAILARINRARLPYTQLLNLNAFSLVPVSMSSLLAFVIAFFSRNIALMILPVGAILGVILLYYGIQKIAAFKSSPFWGFAGVLFGNIAVSVLSLLLAIKLFN